MLLLLQFLVVAFTFAVWWLARRDLTRVAIERNAPAVEEWTELHKAVNSLIADLERRAAAAEQRVAAAEQRLQLLVSELDAGSAVGQIDAAPSEQPRMAEEPPVEPRFAAVYALADSGVADVREIARQTGLECGEIELVLALRPRRLRS